jgi:hypothetical protein
MTNATVSFLFTLSDALELSLSMGAPLSIATQYATSVALMNGETAQAAAEALTAIIAEDASLYALWIAER